MPCRLGAEPAAATAVDQRTCIDTICVRLKLSESKTASVVLDEIFHDNSFLD
jgi:hypothetical protein